MFRRLHNNKIYEGSGIGLALCKKIVEKHNGYISVRSEPGKGSTFIITLPLNNQLDISKNQKTYTLNTAK
jgi:signal transduction histidine kinase